MESAVIVEWKNEKQGPLLDAAPVLNGIRRLLSIKANASIYAINVAVKLPRPYILEVLARNEKMLYWTEKGRLYAVGSGEWIERVRPAFVWSKDVLIRMFENDNCRPPTNAPLVKVSVRGRGNWQVPLVGDDARLQAVS
jgi:hypothetical protein